jgi:glycogen(starch) synthase
MKVLTFGWDFPPHTTGGLGVACQGLTRELAKSGVEVIFVLPKKQDVEGNSRFIFADVERMVKTREIQSSIAPYLGSQSLLDVYDEYGVRKLYQNTLLEEVHAFAHKASLIAREEDFDIIHAHDWTSYLAGVAAKIVSGKPLILHVHATAFDPSVFNIEREAFNAADCIVAVSNFTKEIIVQKYGTAAEKVHVVHNGIDTQEPVQHVPTLQELRAQGKKIVLYHGRITIQKGVDYFIKAAQKVIEYDPNIIFVISGKGDMTGQIMQQVGALGLSQHVLFAGALWYQERDQMYQSVDLVVMPSVSEPFGLVPLEAIQHGTPSLISKQSGVAEVITHVLKVDFWDVDEMANKILAALRYPVMHRQLVQEGKREVSRLSWGTAATKIMHIYQRLLEWIK